VCVHLPVCLCVFEGVCTEESAWVCVQVCAKLNERTNYQWHYGDSSAQQEQRMCLMT